MEEAGEVRTGAILRAFESQMGRCAEEGEAEDMKEQMRLALEWLAGCKEGDQMRRIVPPGAEEGTRQEVLARARKIIEYAKKEGPGDGART